MKQIIFALINVLLAGGAIAQNATPAMDADMQKELKAMRASKPMFGIKGGYNIAKVRGSSANFMPNTKNGFMLAAFYAPANKGGLGYRSEIVFSRQGFGFDEAGKTTSVTSDYVYLPQFTTFGITKYFQLQVGGQIGYLLKSSKQSAGNEQQDISSFANRLDYGAAFGAEIYPIKNLVIGGRYNFSLGDSYKQPGSDVSIQPFPLPFNPSEVKGKNAVINIFVGVRF